MKQVRPLKEPVDFSDQEDDRDPGDDDGRDKGQFLMRRRRSPPQGADRAFL